MNHSARLEERLQNKSATVAVLGLGYVGLPLCREFCHAGFNVIGFDIDQKKINSLNQGISYIDAVPSPELKDYVSQSKFEASADFKRLKDVDAMMICVPTPLDKNKEPDLRYIPNFQIAEEAR